MKKGFFGLGGDPVIPATPKAERLGDAISGFLDARKALRKARAKVPNYTAQWSSEEYYAAEKEAYNRAADELAAAVRNVKTR